MSTYLAVAAMTHLSISMHMTLADLLKDSADKLTQFKPARIAALETAITLKTFFNARV